MSSRRRVLFVGGVERIERELAFIGDELGLDVRIHDGHARGQSMGRLAAVVRGCEMVVLVTGVNSHGAVQIAKREAQKAGAAVRIVKFCGSATARALLAELAHAGAA